MHNLGPFLCRILHDFCKRTFSLPEGFPFFLLGHVPLPTFDSLPKAMVVADHPTLVDWKESFPCSNSVSLCSFPQHSNAKSCFDFILMGFAHVLNVGFVVSCAMACLMQGTTQAPTFSNTKAFQSKTQLSEHTSLEGIKCSKISKSERGLTPPYQS